MPVVRNQIASKARALRSRLLTLPIKIGDTAVLFTKQRFAQKNWIGNNVEYWRPRKKFTRWGATPRNKGRALLVDTGRLRRSIRIMGKTATTVTVGSDVPYAKAHNDGFKGKATQRVTPHTRKLKQGGTTNVKAHDRTIQMNIPRRRFIGQSQYLSKQIQRIISSEIMKAIK
jgi:phage gpG-like protein